MGKLLKRAGSFLKTAELRLKWGDYDLACLDAEQALQLYLKAVLLELFGFPTRTHGILEHLSLLRRELSTTQHSSLAEELSSLVKEKRAIIDLLDESYIEGRYGLAEGYTKELAEQAIKTARQVINLLEKIREKVRRA